MMGAITIFGKKNLIFKIVNYGLVIKSLGHGCTFEEVAKKTNYQKMNVKFLQPN
jgi:hypothetical protein